MSWHPTGTSWVFSISVLNLWMKVKGKWGRQKTEYICHIKTWWVKTMIEIWTKNLSCLCLWQAWQAIAQSQGISRQAFLRLSLLSSPPSWLFALQKRFGLDYNTLSYYMISSLSQERRIQKSLAFFFISLRLQRGNLSNSCIVMPNISWKTSGAKWR